MKGRKLLLWCSICILFCSALSPQNLLHTSILPSVSGDNDNERCIHLESFYNGVNAEVYFNETYWEDGYTYDVSYQFDFEEWYDSSNEEEFMIISWTVGTSIYSYIHILDIEGEKDGTFNFTTSQPFSSCSLSSEHEVVFWVSEDHIPNINSFGGCVLVVDDIYYFEFAHYIFTDYAMYAIQNHVTFCPVLINQSVDLVWYTISGSVQWNIHKVAAFDSSEDLVINQVNASSHYGFYMGYSQDWLQLNQILTNGTNIPGNGSAYTSSSTSTHIPDPFPHQVIYGMELESENASAHCCFDIAFVSPSYFPSESEWKLLPGWAKFTIIGGSISLFGWCVFIGFIAFKLMKNTKLWERIHSWKEGIDS